MCLALLLKVADELRVMEEKSSHWHFLFMILMKAPIWYCNQAFILINYYLEKILYIALKLLVSFWGYKDEYLVN